MIDSNVLKAAQLYTNNKDERYGDVFLHIYPHGARVIATDTFSMFTCDVTYWGGEDVKVISDDFIKGLPKNAKVFISEDGSNLTFGGISSPLLDCKEIHKRLADRMVTFFEYFKEYKENCKLGEISIEQVARFIKTSKIIDKNSLVLDSKINKKQSMIFTKIGDAVIMTAPVSND